MNVQNTTISSTERMKVFGVKIDNKLNFTEHISDVCIKAGRQLNILQRLKRVLDYKSRMVIYKSFIMSNFDYCPIVWMFTGKKSLDRIENIKKHALRFVLDDYGSSYHDLLIQTEVPGIKIMTLRLLAIEVFKCVNKLNPEYLNEMFTIKSAHTTFVILLFWKDLNRIQQGTGLNPVEIVGQKYGICYQTTVNQLYHWVTLRI